MNAKLLFPATRVLESPVTFDSVSLGLNTERLLPTCIAMFVSSHLPSAREREQAMRRHNRKCMTLQTERQVWPASLLRSAFERITVAMQKSHEGMAAVSSTTRQILQLARSGAQQFASTEDRLIETLCGPQFHTSGLLDRDNCCNYSY